MHRAAVSNNCTLVLCPVAKFSPVGNTLIMAVFHLVSCADGIVRMTRWPSSPRHLHATATINVNSTRILTKKVKMSAVKKGHSASSLAAVVSYRQ